MSEELSEAPEWIKLPIDLQHGFFELAAKEAEELSKVIMSINESLKKLKVLIAHHIHPLPNQYRRLAVAAVDSSRSPKLSERLGIKYGVYATGVVYLRGFERREEFKPGIFRCRQALSREDSKRLFDLVTTLHEREMAQKALKECNILFLDGSFYSFVYPALAMKKSGSLERREREILENLFNITEELRESGKVLGVIKRSHSRIIGGYMLLERGCKDFINILDKHILTLIMPERSFLEYNSIISDEHPVTYTKAAAFASRISGSIDDLREIARKGTYRPFDVLDLPAEGFASMRRAQVRFYGDPSPCELEYPNTMDLRSLLSEEGLFNETTNLPLALDLVDSLVNISSKFTEEFVSEIEGRVLEKIARDNESIEAIKAFFAFLNPQKPF